MEEINLRNYAYLGDSIWELFIRKKTILKTNNAKRLHQMTTNLVKTSFQSILLDNLLEDMLTDEEKELVRRARNLPIPIGRRGIQHEYRKATAFETLIGWWYLHNKERYLEITTFLTDKLTY